MQQINVEEIIEEIRKEIEEKGYKDDMLSFQEVPVYDEYCSDSLDGLLNQMRESFYIEWKRPVAPGIKGLLQKTVRKFSGFLIAPVTGEQSNYNYFALKLSEKMYLEMEEQKKEIEEQRKTLRRLERRIRILEGK